MDPWCGVSTGTLTQTLKSERSSSASPVATGGINILPVHLLLHLTHSIALLVTVPRSRCTFFPSTPLTCKYEQVEVYGTLGGRRSPGMVTQCWAGKYVTTVVIAAAEDPADAEIAYKKAVQADAFNAEVLRQLENFFSAYEEWGRGDAFKVGESSGSVGEGRRL